MNDTRKIQPESPAHEERLRILKETMPECFTEGRLDPEKLREQLGEYNLEENTERYGLFWPGKREARARAFKPSKMALHRAPKEGVNEKTTKNLIIEGENLEVLRLLSKAYRGRVKLIYIDPPYNTGNDFVYDDKFAESPLEFEKRTGLRAEDGTALQSNRKNSGRYHSNWLSMMYPRLTLAREIIRKDGFLFMSIDENEVTNARLMLDEIFGAECFHSIVIVQSNKRGHTYDEIAKTHEYLLIYKKSDEALIGELEKEENDLLLQDNLGPFNIRELRNRNPKFGKHNRPNLFYPFFINVSKADADGFVLSLLNLLKHLQKGLNLITAKGKKVAGGGASLKHSRILRHLH